MQPARKIRLAQLNADVFVWYTLKTPLEKDAFLPQVSLPGIDMGMLQTSSEVQVFACCLDLASIELLRAVDFVTLCANGMRSGALVRNSTSVIEGYVINVFEMIVCFSM